jgi:hypothetical protein
MKTTTINFNASKEDREKLDQIVSRFQTDYQSRTGVPPADPLSVNMDLTVTHLNGTPLDLDKLLASDNFNFLHDVMGIIRHLNRTTGKLKDHFLPRCARKDSAEDIFQGIKVNFLDISTGEIRQYSLQRGTLKQQLKRLRYRIRKVEEVYCGLEIEFSGFGPDYEMWSGTYSSEEGYKLLRAKLQELNSGYKEWMQK